jgi:hypothetical protein
MKIPSRPLWVDRVRHYWAMIAQSAVAKERGPDEALPEALRLATTLHALADEGWLFIAQR